jgi:ATP-dependent RNA helicase RhlE
VLRLANELLDRPATVSIALSKPAAGVRQGAYVVYEAQKLPLMVHVLSAQAGKRVIVFSSTKLVVNTLYQQLKRKGLSVGQISSDLEQDAREQMMIAYKNRQVDILVATDVLSRGIDVDGIDMVINYDCPRDAEDYVHRIGRTARGNKTGEAITLIGPPEQMVFKRIEVLIGSEVPKLPLPEEIGLGPAYDPSSVKEHRGGQSAGGGNRGRKHRSSAGKGGDAKRSQEGKSRSKHRSRPKGSKPSSDVKP